MPRKKKEEVEELIIEKKTTKKVATKEDLNKKNTSKTKKTEKEKKKKPKPLIIEDEQDNTIIPEGIQQENTTIPKDVQQQDSLIQEEMPNILVESEKTNIETNDTQQEGQFLVDGEENIPIEEPKSKIEKIVNTTGVSKKFIFGIIAVFAVLVLVILGIAILLIFIKDTYQYVNVGIGTMYDMTSGKGIIESANSEIIRSPISSTVREVFYTMGSEVKKGQLLLEFDTTYVNEEVEKYQIARKNVRDMIAIYTQKNADLNILGTGKGFITDLNYTIGSQVKEGDILGYYIPTTTFKLNCKARYSLSNSVQEWQMVNIKYDGGEVQGVVYKVSGNQSEGELVDVEIYVNTDKINLSGVSTTEIKIVTMVGTIDAQELDSFESNVKLPIYAKESGVVENIIVKAGSSFAEGTIIMTLKNDSIVNKLKELKANEERLTRYVDVNVSNIDNYKIYATTDGLVESVPLVSKQTVSKDEELVKITVEDKMKVNIKVTVGYITRLEIGQEVEIIPNVEGAKTLKGRITSKDPYQIGKEDEYNVEIFLDEENASLSLLGKESKVNIIFNQKDDTLYVPINSIIEEEGGKYVDVHIGSDKKERVKVLTGIQYNGKIEILSGLKNGQQILEYFR